jgi:hypothetical protein
MTWIGVTGLKGVGYVAGLWLLTFGGNLVCRCVLKVSGIPPRPAKKPPELTTGAAQAFSAPQGPEAPPVNEAPAGLTQATVSGGRYIGSIERTIIMLGLVAGSWELVASVIALKSVSRFKELDHQLRAEYFLVGSLVSLLWAMMISGALVAYDQHCGFHVASIIKTLFPQPK